MIDLEEYAEGWIAIKNCTFTSPYDQGDVGKVLSIDFYEGYGVCAKVDFRTATSRWYRYEDGCIEEMHSGPSGRKAGFAPPGCWL